MYVFKKNEAVEKKTSDTLRLTKTATIAITLCPEFVLPLTLHSD